MSLAKAELTLKVTVAAHHPCLHRRQTDVAAGAGKDGVLGYQVGWAELS